MLLLFLLLTSVSATCRNGGSLGSDGCECVDGYTGNHCQVSPPTFCRHNDQFVNLNTMTRMKKIESRPKIIDQ